MRYDATFYKDYLKKVNGFKEIDWVGNYLELSKKPNFWSILEYGKNENKLNKKTSYEIRYSKMLKWLLDANENHNLGNIFAAKLIQKLNGDESYRFNSKKNKFIDCYSEKDDIDIFFRDKEQKVCIAIELKHFSKEHASTGYESQLDKYEDIIKAREDRENSVHYIYLTPRKDKPSNSNWRSLGYEDVIEIIKEIDRELLLNSDDVYVNDTKKIILDFRDDLQRSIDICNKDASYIRNNFTNKELQFTSLLADEINHETKSENINELVKIDDSDDLKEIILLINEYMYTQDHTPNDGVRLFMRKVYNYMAKDKELDFNLDDSIKLNQVKTEIKPDIISRYSLDFHEIALTNGKGQGAYLFNNFKNRKIYFSGDKDGHFPNDYMSVLNDEGKKADIKSVNIRNKMFKISYDLIEKDKLTLNDGGMNIDINFNDFMEQYLLEEIKVLNDRLNQNK